MVSAYKKHQMLIAVSVGLFIGIFMAIAFWVATQRWFSFFIIPVAGLIGLAQAYMAPEGDD